MLIKPDLKDEEIVRCLRHAYGLTVEKVKFLPIGLISTRLFIVLATNNGSDYFLKLRRGEFLEASVSVPKYLADLGVQHVVPCLVTKTGELWASFSSFTAILTRMSKAVMAQTPNH